jgi:hypothetical protein
MDEKIDRMEKNINDLIEIVVAIKDNMVTKDELAGALAEVREDLGGKIASGLAEVREDLGGKIGGVQRALDSAFERQSALDASVSKIEAELRL